MELFFSGALRVFLVSQSRAKEKGTAVSVFFNNTIPERLDLLDRYFSKSESRVSGIRDGCEKKFVWHNNKRQQRDLAIVYIHGFSASRMETWPLCDRLAEAIGANLFYTRLTGHGQDGDAMV